MWRVTSEEDRHRWCSWGENGLEGDADTLEELQALVNEDAYVPATVTGPMHDVTGMDDELGLFLLATQTAAVPPPRTIIGTPPVAAPAEVPEEATP